MTVRLTWPRVTVVQDHQGNPVNTHILGYQLWCIVSIPHLHSSVIISRMLSKYKQVINRMLSDINGMINRMLSNIRMLSS